MCDITIIPVKQTKQCCICMDETKTIVPHPCNTCSENSWFVCDECSQKLKKCPICRKIIQKNNSDNNEIYNNESNFMIKQCLFWLIAIIQVLAVYVCLVYTGKLYYYIICSIQCNTFSLKKMQEYECYHVSEPNFLTNYSQIVSETVIGIIITAILFGIYKGIKLCYWKYIVENRIVDNTNAERQIEIEEV